MGRLPRSRDPASYWSKNGVSDIVNRFLAAERALRTAAPTGCRTRSVTCCAVGAAGSVELLMADYGLTVLQPVSVLSHALETLPVHSSPTGRAFGAPVRRPALT